DAVGDLVDTIELSGELRAGCKLNQHVVTLGLIVDGVCELSLAPLIHIGDGAVLTDERLELFHIGSDTLFTHFGVEDHHCLVVCCYLWHCWCTSFWTLGPVM